VSDPTGILLPYWSLILLIGYSLACVGGLLVLAHRHRRLQPFDAEDAPYTPPAFSPAEWHPDRRGSLEKELTEIKSKYDRLRHTYTVLLNRHKALVQQLQRLQGQAPKQVLPKQAPPKTPLRPPREHQQPSVQALSTNGSQAPH
jgi:hypothetical protein